MAISATPQTIQPIGKIRAIVLGLIRQGDRLLVAEGYDPVKRSIFYRALGGGIEFGETSLNALHREFMEEIQAELTNIQYLGCLENLFVYNGRQKHELVQLYRCDLVEPALYQQAQIPFRDGDRGEASGTAYWIAIDRFKSGELRLVPETCLNYL
jgi:8-oxo-dGTP pyrophosphatase MutT (NUDIX family)